MHLEGKKIAILATHGFEQSELEVPRDRLKEHGATVHVVSPEQGENSRLAREGLGEAVNVEVTLDQANPDDFDAIVPPGGQINPDLLRVNDQALQFIRAFHKQKKVIAAVCHAP